MTATSSSTSSYAPSPAAGPSPREVAARIGLAARRYPIVQVLVLVLLCAYAYHTIPGIGTRNSIYANLILAAFLGLVALGQTLVILMGGIDFSVAGFVLLGATVT
jgi:ribose transport system permease protein